MANLTPKTLASFGNIFVISLKEQVIELRPALALVSTQQPVLSALKKRSIY